ncbi:MAG: EAL domain-containing protein [Proteobacteria bacterium]|nr:EAL domain-containing protein [Pseudomonadota bacterium]
MDTTPQRTDEETLLSDLDRIKRTGNTVPRMSVVISMQRQAWFNRRRENYYVIFHAIREMVQRAEGTIYSLANFDIVFVFRVDNPQQFESIVTELDDLLRRHSVATGMPDENIEEACTWYSFETQFPDFYDYAKAALEEQKSQQEARLRALQRAGSAAAAGPAYGQNFQSLTPAVLGQLEEAFGKADAKALIRNQPVSIALTANQLRPIFREYFFSVNDVRNLMTPRINMRGQRGLFQMLTRTFDARMLRALSEGFLTKTAGNISINLNVDTILSDRFREFDQRIGNFVAKGNIIIEIARHDVFSDFEAYNRAIDTLQKAGYRSLLDGLTPDTLTFFRRSELRADLVKLFFFKDHAEDWRMKGLAAMLAEADINRIIMGRCETPMAFELGQAVGIRMFQGWHVDALMRAMMPAAPPAR